MSPLAEECAGLQCHLETVPGNPLCKAAVPADGLSKDEEVATQDGASTFSRQDSPQSLCTWTGGDEPASCNEYGSCFWVPPPPPNVRRIYHNRKRTSYTDYAVEAPLASTPSMTLVKLLETEANPSRSLVMKTAFAEGDAHEDSNLADVLHAPNARGWPPMVIATQRKQVDAVSALLELGAPVDCQDPSSGWTPLMYAVANGDEPMVRRLLENGAETNAFVKPSDWNALCVAIMSSQRRLVKVLLDSGADLQLIKKRHPALAETYTAEASGLCACEVTLKGKCRMCKLVTHKGWSYGGGCMADKSVPSSLDRPALVVAAQNRRQGEVAELLERGADVECHDPASGWTPLMYAAANGDKKSLRRLLVHGASPNTFARPSCWNALCVAILSSHWEVVVMLLDHGADLDFIKRWHPDIVQSYSAEISASAEAAASQRARREGK